MPFLDPEELKPKLREVFETVVIPQIKKAKMKQTAVQWFYCHYMTEMQQHGEIEYNFLNKLFDQAKAMEKEHIKDAWLNSLTKGDYNSAEQYYNETFKSE